MLKKLLLLKSFGKALDVTEKASAAHKECTNNWIELYKMILKNYILKKMSLMEKSFVILRVIFLKINPEKHNTHGAARVLLSRGLFITHSVDEASARRRHQDGEQSAWSGQRKWTLDQFRPMKTERNDCYTRGRSTFIRLIIRSVTHRRDCQQQKISVLTCCGRRRVTDQCVGCVS